MAAVPMKRETELIVTCGAQRYRIGGRVAKMILWLCRSEEGIKSPRQGKVFLSYSGQTVNAEHTVCESDI